MTVEEVNDIWRRECLHTASGIFAKKSSIFKDDYVKRKAFEDFISLIERSQGFIDAHLYIKFVANLRGGWFCPSILSDKKIVLAYTRYVRQNTINNSLSEVKQRIYNSSKFIIQYCVDNNVKNLDSYFCLNMNIYATYLKHLCSGTLSFDFCACVPNFIKLYFNNLPYDTRMEKDFINMNSIIALKRVTILTNKNEIGKIATDIHEVINESIRRVKENVKKNE